MLRTWQYIPDEQQSDVIRKYMMEGCRRAPAAPLHSASVLLTRERGGTVEVLVIQRSEGLLSFPGTLAFPGGCVNSEDGEAIDAWKGPVCSTWGTRLGCGSELARSLLACAVRELFEEVGVLVASDIDGKSASFSSDAALKYRTDLENRVLSMSGFLKENELVLRSDWLEPLSRWISPEYAARRFDTVFFRAQIPFEYEIQAVNGEVASVWWRKPEDVIAMAQEGGAPVAPATLSNLHRLLELNAGNEFDTSLHVPTFSVVPELTKGGNCICRVVCLDGGEIRECMPS